MNKKIIKKLDDKKEKYQLINKYFFLFYETIKLFIDTIAQGKMIYICGNGGSSCDAEHLASEFVKNYKLKISNNKINSKINETDYNKYDFLKKLQSGLPVISLNNIGAITAISNDIDYEVCFAQQVVAYSKKNDLIIHLSTSGTSKNIINSIIVAKILECKTIILRGNKNNCIDCDVDVDFVIDECQTDLIQIEMFKIIHIICEIVEELVYEK